MRCRSCLFVTPLPLFSQASSFVARHTRLKNIQTTSLAKREYIQISPFPIVCQDVKKNGSTSDDNSGSKPPTLAETSLFIQDRVKELQQLVADREGTKQAAITALTGIRDIATLTTIRALGLKPFIEDLETVSANPPSDPPFDPVLALYLAGYSFQAYSEPPSSSYRETYVSKVRASKISKLKSQIIRSDFVYPDSSLLKGTATGVFILTVENPTRLPDTAYLTITINSAVARDLLHQRTVSILRGTLSENKSCQESKDTLRLDVYRDESAYENGEVPMYTSSQSLAHLVNAVEQDGVPRDDEKCVVYFRPLNEEEKEQDFFLTSLLSQTIELPFGRKFQSNKIFQLVGQEDDPITISLRASFIPMKSEHQGEMLNDNPENSANDSGSAQNIESERESKPNISGDYLNDTREVLEKQLPEGELPNEEDWKRIADLARLVTQRFSKRLKLHSKTSVTADIPRVLFVESHATDTEVWLFRDEERKIIIVSFRGTEQVSWQDFFTDAQLFLQRWVPGEEIDLNIESGTTVGFQGIIPPFLSELQSDIPDDAIAVHYGFLRAYMSVRSALQKGLSTLSCGFDEDYSFFFTGHSLGGALAMIAAVDSQILNQLKKDKISCMSYGAPKVGNVNFARLYNQLVPNSFRIVNDTDLVARMPRSLSIGKVVDRYKHSGRTVLVAEDGKYWIEGQEGEEIVEFEETESDPFRDTYKDVSELIAFESRQWNELLSGRSVQQHMEDAYFTTLQRVMEEVLKRTIPEIGLE